MSAPEEHLQLVEELTSILKGHKINVEVELSDIDRIGEHTIYLDGYPLSNEEVEKLNIEVTG